MGKTFAEKVLGKKAGKEVVAGEIVEIVPDFAMSHDNTAAIAKTRARANRRPWPCPNTVRDTPHTIFFMRIQTFLF